MGPIHQGPPDHQEESGCADQEGAEDEGQGHAHGGGFEEPETLGGAWRRAFRCAVRPPKVEEDGRGEDTSRTVTLNQDRRLCEGARRVS